MPTRSTDAGLRELARLLDEDAVVIGDGGDFVSYAGKYVEPKRPGGWLDPGPYGCLGTGLGYAIAARIARPQAQVVLLLVTARRVLADGRRHAVRHGCRCHDLRQQRHLGLEKHPCRPCTGTTWPRTCSRAAATTQVVRPWAAPRDRHPAAGHRARPAPAFGSGVPYLVNVITDPPIAYPRSTTGI
jgi:acetolactate synthase-1/2/3 large subunit